ncbi:gliding motility-associated peptidyl-prolyl isomerase GldI [Winogradskyella immobilis]|uniref:Peptidyl-prolyl cis-trans isomerase n=1 Tax=Winogradskyella immobilis TaxID=2816852 RepID=A0ABS8EQ82_9FLAO|nr:gliding motility-associated peptidyl-prolyl isomerase GldI [Winogradskyella immobilis]MCC1485166.1 gliding motility-associated peptidyl-prolyl isomerase GldI [Winogradskyella immobilis]MCG0017258.1 gliding motility-associated peptidyl-prolyl isomerase GldI [Winogradskyella immobilis]
MKHLLLILIITISLASCKSPEARLPESVQSGSFIKQSAERNKILIENERLKIETIIDKDSIKDYIVSENGFWYYYNTRVEKDTITPQFGDRVNFSYNVSDLNGATIYSKDEIGTKDYLMDQEILFTGLREGLKLMKPSEIITFIFPSQVAYGYYGDDNKIGTNIPIVCEVTLNTLIQNKND